MTRMHNPPHPASILREDVLPELGLSIAAAAEQLGVSRVTLSRLLNERAAISPEMALRLEQWLGPDNGGDAGFWMRMQAEHDMWRARQALVDRPLNVRRAVSARA